MQVNPFSVPGEQFRESERQVTVAAVDAARDEFDDERGDSMARSATPAGPGQFVRKFPNMIGTSHAIHARPLWQRDSDRTGALTAHSAFPC